MVAAWAAGGAALATLLLPAANPTRKSARAGHTIVSRHARIQFRIRSTTPYSMRCVAGRDTIVCCAFAIVQ